MTEDEKNKAKIIMGPAFLKPDDEKDHFGLYRYMIVEKYDDVTGRFIKQQVEPPVGPLMIFRIAAKDDRVDMRTVDPKTMKELSLIKVWDARKGFV